MYKLHYEKAKELKKPLSKTMQVAKITFMVLVISQTIPILLLGMESINQIAIALFPTSKAVLLPVLITSEALVLAGMVTLVVYRVKKAKKAG